MGWFSSKREIAELRKQVAQLAQAIAHQHQPAGVDIGQILVGLVDGQVKQVESFGGFIRTVSDIAAERMGSVLGRRGGKKRAASAQRDARGRMLPGRAARAGESNCILCDDPTASSFTTQEFEEHQKHKNRPRRIEPERIEPTPEEEIIINQPPAEPARDYPLPYVQHPLVPAADGNAAGGTGSGTESGDGHAAGERNGIA